eukprot:TRINITY_DN10263_c0_g1_i1.p1 TRINITY_DN10263_c0_g1~~TRINITY_DN10263_c0_g1_i1.p1  ORF type:complete len:239 (-),score=16.68 TRINITY_DN10263_c0_g1_i1:383-1060(-)
MASIDDLEKQVAKLKEQLAAEVAKTGSVEKELKELTEVVAGLKSSLATPKSVDNGGDESSGSEEGDHDDSAMGTTPGQGSIVLSGVLEKKGTVRHNWLKRWFELDSEQHYLNYYDNPKGSQSEPRGSIPLINATCYAHVEKKGQVKPLFFNIRTETRDFLLKALSKEDKAQWVAAIKAQCIKGNLTPEMRKQLMRKGSSFIGKTQDDIPPPSPGSSSASKEHEKE